jgi:hypothetical protein
MFTLAKDRDVGIRSQYQDVVIESVINLVLFSGTMMIKKHQQLKWKEE